MSSTTMTEREQWLVERRTYLGGTDVASLAGHGFSSPLEVYLEKVDDSPPVDTSPSRRALVGQRLESDVRDWVREDYGWVSAPGCLVRMDGKPYLAANPDGFIGDSELLEIKTYGVGSQGWGEPGTAEVPMGYYIQSVWYLGITGRERMRLAALDRGSLSIKPYVIEKDPATFESLCGLASSFWLNHVEPRVPPPALAGDGALVARLFPKDDGSSLQADADAEAMLQRCLDISEAIRPYEDELDRLRDQLKIVLGPHRTLSGTCGQAMFATRAGSVAWKALAESFSPTPEQIEAYRAAPTRFLTIRRAKES